MPHGSSPSHPNPEQPAKPAAEFDVVDKTEKNIDSPEKLLSKAETVVSDFEKNGLQEAEEIASEFGVEVDDQTKLELQRLAVQARQAEDFFKSSLKNRFLDTRSKVLNKFFPGSSIAGLAKMTAEIPFREKLEKQIYSYKEFPPSNLEDLVNAISNYDRINRESYTNFHASIEAYFEQVEKKQGIDRAIEDYKKIPPELLIRHYDSDLGQLLVLEAYNDLKEKGAVESKEEAMPFLLEKFEGINELILSGHLGKLDNDVLAKLISESPDTPGAYHAIAARMQNSNLNGEQYAIIRDKLFKVYLELEPARLLNYPPHIDSFNDLPAEARAEKIQEMIRSNPSKFAMHLGSLRVPEAMADKIWPSIRNKQIPFIKGYINNREAYRKLGVTNRDAIDAAFVKESGLGDLLDFFEQDNIDDFGFGKEDKDYTLQKMLSTLEPDHIFRLQGRRNCFSKENMVQVVDKVLKSKPLSITHLHELVQSTELADLDSAKLDEIAKMLLADRLSQHYLIDNLEKFSFDEGRNFDIVDSVEIENAWTSIANLLDPDRKALSPSMKKIIRIKLAVGLPQTFLTNYDKVIKSEEDGKLIAPVLYDAILNKNFADHKFATDLLVQNKLYSQERMLDDSETRQLVYTKIFQTNPSNYMTYMKKLEGVLPETMDLTQYPAGKTYVQLEKLQARSANEEHDPWKTDLDPLVKYAAENKILNLDNAADGEVLIDFVKQYGMSNVPTILKWHAILERAHNIEDIPQQSKREMEKELGIEISTLDNKGQVTQEIKNFKNRIQDSLLKDEIPKELLNGKVGQEIFGMLKGNTKWATNDSLSNMVYKWQSFSKRKPELATVPEGYTEINFDVPALIRRSLNETEAQQLQRKEDEILNNVQLEEIIGSLNQAFQNADRLKSTISEEGNEGAAQEGVLKRWEEIKINIISELTNQKDVINSKIESEQKEQARIGMAKQLDSLNQSIDEVQGYKGSQDINEMLENLIKIIPKKYSNRDDVLRELSMKQMIELDQDKANELKESLDFSTNSTSEQKLDAWSRYLVDYVNEHYLNPSQVEDHTRHQPFSGDLLKELQFLYGIKPDFKKNLIVRSKEKLAGLRNQGVESSSKNIDITLVPNKGLLRVYSGDVGDACYSSKHEQLAEGMYSGITAFTFVTGRGTVNERLRGSLLAIETETPAGEKVLLVRANNPQENLLGQVNNEILIQKTLEEMKQLAAKRGIGKVVVPLDGASASCSNRKSVAGYYRKKYFGEERVALEDSSETNFNGYNVWNPDGSHGVVEI